MRSGGGGGGRDVVQTDVFDEEVVQFGVAVDVQSNHPFHSLESQSAAAISLSV